MTAALSLQTKLIGKWQSAVRDAGGIRTKHQADARKLLTKASTPDQFWEASAKTHSYAWRIAGVGILNIADGDMKGLDMLAQAMWFPYWTIKTRLTCGWRPLGINEIGVTMTMLLWSGHFKEGKWLAKILLSNGVYCEWNDTSYSGFFVKLANVILGEPPSKTTEAVRPPMREYDEVFLAWDAPTAFTKALHWLLERHDPFKEFPGWFLHFDCPHDFIPSEVLCLLRLRERASLPVPQLNHLLLDTPVMKACAKGLPPPGPDEMTELVIAKATELIHDPRDDAWYDKLADEGLKKAAPHVWGQYVPIPNPFPPPVKGKKRK